ncbi:helix-turn-helix transcriptional regulator [Petroclostridium sp. X23]|uniref:helix-turn-helix transcriptional regulator n=1 Tax=Petroclostridium sp. X23 TaxID=3045146 RepID=UPI0024AD500C|nr:helix-turn-helix transcriptional regulator [Petroclostridium sp. X23]WHH59736.1 helix-turn-helix transcriptional regulator [Petroclostridium sp. X23]
MHNKDLDKLGKIIKAARKENNLTREQLAEKINITPRYLMSIENENKKPSYNVLFNLIRKLGISADRIFFPEKLHADSKVGLLIQLLYMCDESELNVITATIKALIDNKKY